MGLTQQSANPPGRYDVVVVGGGHNALVAATYLARAGLAVLLLERDSRLGGAARNSQPFPGVPATLSEYAYLVSLLPDQIIADLQLDLTIRKRALSSYTPAWRDGRHVGLTVENSPSQITEESFLALTGNTAEFANWRRFYRRYEETARALTAHWLAPLPRARSIRQEVPREAWRQLTELPLGETLESSFDDDAVRGIVATDAIIGTYADLHDPALRQNRCFLYHVTGNGTGQWRVPVGGMGAVSQALEFAALRAGVKLRTNSTVTRVEADGVRGHVTWQDEHGAHSCEADWVLAGVAPWALSLLLGQAPGARPEGSQFKVNMLLRRLPRLRSGEPASRAFAGTMHINEGYYNLQATYAETSHGRLPRYVPGEIYCHSLTDPSVLGQLAVDGVHALSFFGVHTPSRLFAGNAQSVRDTLVERSLDSINLHLAEPIESLLLRDSNGQACIQAKSPLDVETALAMPGGHIFHGDLRWPWAEDDDDLDTPAQRWGVATSVPNVLLCGAGAQRGGGVSGIAGHNAAHAVLEARMGRR